MNKSKIELHNFCVLEPHGCIIDVVRLTENNETLYTVHFSVMVRQEPTEVFVMPTTFVDKDLNKVLADAVQVAIALFTSIASTVSVIDEQTCEILDEIDISSQLVVCAPKGATIH